MAKTETIYTDKSIVDISNTITKNSLIRGTPVVLKYGKLVQVFMQFNCDDNEISSGDLILSGLPQFAYYVAYYGPIVSLSQNYRYYLSTSGRMTVVDTALPKNTWLTLHMVYLTNE